MKQKLIAALVTSAIAGLAATSVQAGPIQASYKVFAAEAFGNTTLSLIAPTVGYSLNNPITGDASNPNTFVAKITLTDGKWDKTNTPTAVLRDPSITNSKNASAVSWEDGDKTAVFTFTIGGGTVSESYPVGSTITFGSHSATPVPLQALNLDTKLKTPLTNACAPTEAQALATVKLFNQSGTQFDTTESAAVFASNVALNVAVTSSSAFDAVTAANNELSKVNVLSTSLGKAFTNGADVTTTSTSTIVLGKVDISDRASLYDSDGATKYSAATGAWTTTVAGDGIVSAKTLNLTVSGKFQGVAANVFLASDAACTTALPVAAATTFNADNTVANISGTVTGLAAASTRTAYVCYTADGTTTIPTAQFAVTAGSLTKDSGSKELANPVCVGNLYNLVSNGVQIDVRNYIPASQSTATGWADVVRFINTDETQSATITAQLIKADGSLLAAGEVLTLAPRAVKYMSNADIEAKLPATVSGAQNDNARLRITSASSSLRVQNYHVNPVTGAVTENSAAQGDDGPDHARQADAISK